VHDGVAVGAVLDLAGLGLLDGLADFELKPSGDLAASGKLKNYTSSKKDGCGLKDANNVKVNQNCLNISDPVLAGRGQAQNETSVAQDPRQPSHLVTSFNDYRRGDGNCYTSYSSNGGASWQDSTPPMGFTLGTAFGGKARQYWQAGGDTSVAWDTRGNAYLSCQMFKRGTAVTEDPDQSSAFYVYRSTGTQGASPGYDPLAFFIGEAGKRGIEVHAWFNPYRGAANSSEPRAANHISRRFPQYAYRIGSVLWMDPGAPAIQENIVNVVRDVVQRYGVAGVHFDDYFYPYPTDSGHVYPFPDDATYAAYRARGRTLSRAGIRCRPFISSFCTS
jgi:hypothetical protein